jgi:hypothetical protein
LQSEARNDYDEDEDEVDDEDENEDGKWKVILYTYFLQLIILAMWLQWYII